MNQEQQKRMDEVRKAMANLRFATYGLVLYEDEGLFAKLTDQDIDQILSLKDIYVADPDQSLPENPWRGKNLYTLIYSKAQQDMHKADFIRVIPKEVE